ncbi:protein argonaute-3 [Galendromus occidentalis]|uniref:Protein argonaute-3 n=1 Tax=Galendromus occidentalis TaxID=34638 RepID=A0AAJ7WIY2_9ACAR|nr:protein argonaute-3 [Galendromus occidentalis]
MKIAPLAAPAQGETLNLPAAGGVIALQKPRVPGKMTCANIQCLTNYYKLNLGKRFSVAYFYTVKITRVGRAPTNPSTKVEPLKPAAGPRKERKLGLKLNKLIFRELSRHDAGDQLLAYDGRARACGLKRIPNDALNLVVGFDNDQWELTLSFEKSVQLTGLMPGPEFGKADDEEEALLGVAIALNHMPALQFTPLGRGFYGLPGETPRSISGGFELWSGYKAHVIPGQDSLYLNVNFAITAFIKPGELIDLLPDLIRENSVPPSLHNKHIAELKKKLTRCKIECEHLKSTNKPKKMTVATITSLPASQITFVNREGRTVTVAQYFAETYSKLQYPNLPCVQVGTEKPRYFPLEKVTVLKGNPYRGEQTPQMVSDIIRQAAIKPRNRLEEIRHTVKILRGQNELQNEFDMQIGEELTVPARILPVPILECGAMNGNQRKTVKVTPGVIDFRSDKFFSGSRITKWTVVITDERASQRDVSAFVEVLQRQGAQTNVQIAPPMRVGGAFYTISDRLSFEKVEKQIESFVGQNGLEFVLFVISESSPIHAAIKFVCDVKLGVSSKCVKGATVYKVTNNQRGGPDQVILNILYGLNPKFDGENVLAGSQEFARQFLESSPTLIIGMDVNHGQAKARDGHVKMPSTVGIVGTRNRNATLYNAYMRAQAKPPNSADKEVIQPQILKTAMDKLLRGFREGSNAIPQRIIVYRDGVSNGQFNAVLDKELRAIVETCQALNKDYRPTITFITVQKRHDTRLFPTKVTKNHKGDEKQNPIAGTVVDNTMTGSRVWSFFLVSHEGIQGTSKPAHYTVLRDENNFTNDQLQSLTYYMCHTYGKCPRAVSLPAPVYYAHHVAFRAAELGTHRFFQDPRHRDIDARTNSSGPNGAVQLAEDEKFVLNTYNEACLISAKYAKSMYFL